MWRNVKKYATSDMQQWGKIYIKLPDHDTTPIAQMADIGFKVVLLERFNQKWKQKHF